MLELDAGAHLTTFEQAEAVHACLPEARDELMRTQTLDATTLATMFPFLSNSLSMPDGVLMGITETREPVMLNPWDRSLENPHLFIGGGDGSGESYPGQLLVGSDLPPYRARGGPGLLSDPELQITRAAQRLLGT